MYGVRGPPAHPLFVWAGMMGGGGGRLRSIFASLTLCMIFKFLKFYKIFCLKKFLFFKKKKYKKIIKNEKTEKKKIK